MLERTKFLIKEHVTYIKTTDTYDIKDPETETLIGQAKEVPGSLVAALRWVISKNFMPTTVEIRDTSDELQFTLRRGWYLFRARIEVKDAQGELIGYFRSKIMTLGGAFEVYTKDNALFAQVRGGKRWFFDYHLHTPEGMEIGQVTKKFGGVVKEIFTSADAFLVTVNEKFTEQKAAKILLLAAAIAVDMIYKEDKSGGGFVSDLAGG
ncbi:MAG: oxidoreductase [Planctomycetes bacterium]|nr:oxidoreductase [Planctomycetota bacterium]